jgi:hypothetical protein
MVRLGADNLPQTVRIAPDWQHRLTAEMFGHAVSEACQKAAGERMSIWWAALQREGWQARADKLGTDRIGKPSAPSADPLSTGLRQQMEEAKPRPLADVADEMMRAAGRVSELSRNPRGPATGSGTAASARLSVTVSGAGLVSCEAEPRWVARQTGAALATALSTALAAARSDLATAVKRAADPADGLDRLLVETLSILSKLSPHTGFEGST